MVEITTATEAHVLQIVELWQEFMDFHKDLDPRFPLRPEAPASYEKYLREQMQSPEWLILVAVDGGAVIGLTTAQIAKYPPIFQRETYGIISEMAVRGNRRRKGIGERLLTRAFEWFRSREVGRVELSVAARNPVGYPFWRKHGFKDYTHRLYRDLK
jgi:GNAT superfamily N-acetyltransferase